MAKSLLPRRDPSRDVEELRSRVQAIYAQHALQDAQDSAAMSIYADFSADELKDLIDAPIDQLKEKGLSRRALRIALYALLPAKEVPFAVKALHERSLAHIKRGEDAEGLVRLGFAIGQLPPRAPRRDDSEVITVEATEVK